MNQVKQQMILAGGGLILLASLFFFGRISTGKINTETSPAVPAKTFNITQSIADSKVKLTPSQAIYLEKLEMNLSGADVPARQIEANNQLAAFWKDSIKAFEPYAHYLAAAAKLDNSEKNLTFAAQLILHNLRGEQDEAKVNWQTEQAIELFEQAIRVNPGNDDLKVGLGSAYVFGKGRFGGPEQTMKGVAQLLEVVRRDSTNMKAQLVLGVGAYVSGQYDKGIARLQKVVIAEPGNLEAVAFLADSYAAKGDKAEAIKWYRISKRMANNPHYSEEVDARIQSLK